MKKYYKTILIVLATLAFSYASLWYGFLKGYEYSQSKRLTDAAMKVSYLYVLKLGNPARVIESLERDVDADLYEYHVSDKGFVNYMLSLPQLDSKLDQFFINQIVEYKKSAAVKCREEEAMCLVLDDFYYNKK